MFAKIRHGTKAVPMEQGGCVGIEGLLAGRGGGGGGGRGVGVYGSLDMMAGKGGFGDPDASFSSSL